MTIVIGNRELVFFRKKFFGIFEIEIDDSAIQKVRTMKVLQYTVVASTIAPILSSQQKLILSHTEKQNKLDKLSLAS